LALVFPVDASLHIKELRPMKNKKIKLTDKDLHIIDVYSKKNLSDTMPQFGSPDEKPAGTAQGMENLQNQNNMFFGD
jgi:hypothetical protein